MTTQSTDPIKVGVITDLTGPLSFMGVANANVADMVVHDVNAAGGLLGRSLRLIVEDSATDDHAAEVAATKMVDEHDVDVVLGGIYSSTRQAIKGPVVERARKLYIYPEQYEGQESDPLIFCTGPVPAQQVEPLIPWLMERTGAKTLLPPVGGLHLAEGAEREGPRGRHGSRRHDRGRGVPPPRPHGLRRNRRAHHGERRGRRVQHDRPARAHAVPRGAARGGVRRGEADTWCAPTSTRTSSTSCPPSTSRVSTAAWTTTARWTDPVSTRLLEEYERRFPGSAQFTAGSACTGMYRGLKLWAAAVTEAGSLDTEAVVKALDTASLAEGPGGPAEMVPGQHHLRLNMYIAQARNGVFEVVENLGRVDPKERAVESR